jgi:acetolactate synthase regulatory subunit
MNRFGFFDYFWLRVNVVAKLGDEFFERVLSVVDGINFKIVVLKMIE